MLVEVAARASAKMVVAEIPFPIRSADEIVGAILASVTSRTRLMLLDQVTSNSAVVLPAQEIIRELEVRGVDTWWMVRTRRACCR